MVSMQMFRLFLGVVVLKSFAQAQCSINPGNGGTVAGLTANCIGDFTCQSSVITGCDSVVCSGVGACSSAFIGDATTPIADTVSCVGTTACESAGIFAGGSVSCQDTAACLDAKIGSLSAPIGGGVICFGLSACFGATIIAESGSCAATSNTCLGANFLTLFMSLCASSQCGSTCTWTDLSNFANTGFCSDSPKSNAPSAVPSGMPSISMMPSSLPSSSPSTAPSSLPSSSPSISGMPSSMPSTLPSRSPSEAPSSLPSSSPSISGMPSSMPSTLPSRSPSEAPSSSPSSSPSTSPSSSPSSMPSSLPSSSPSTPPTESTTSPSSCLSPETVVEVRDKGPTRIVEVEVGDLVIIGQNKFALVISRGHFNHQPVRSFLQINTTDGSQPLEVTKEHLVFILARRGVRNWRSDDDGDGKAVSEDHIVAVPAKEVVVGDYVLSKDGATLQVTAITSVERQGVYSPFTTTGTIVANGVLVSNYAVADDMETILRLGRFLRIPYQTMAHAALAHARVLCAIDFSLCLEEGREGSWAQSAMEQNGGITPWALPYTWLLGQHVIVKYAGFVLIAPLVLISYGLELVSVSQKLVELQMVAAATATAAALMMTWWIVQARLAHKENKKW